MDDRYSQYSHGALTLDTSVASSAASMMSSTGSIQSASTATSSDIYGWEEELDRKVSMESGNHGWGYVQRIPLGGRTVGTRGHGGAEDYQLKRADGKRRSLLYRVLNLSNSRRESVEDVSISGTICP
jgi:hypothetical protein